MGEDKQGVILAMPATWVAVILCAITSVCAVEGRCAKRGIFQRVDDAVRGLELICAQTVVKHCQLTCLLSSLQT